MRKWMSEKRNSLGLTQECVAKKAGIARTTYSMIERGERNASVVNAKKIANVLDFNWTIFFEDECHDSRKSHSA
jgi:putative transcriptional regulator